MEKEKKAQLESTLSNNPEIILWCTMQGILASHRNTKSTLLRMYMASLKVSCTFLATYFQ